MKSIFALVAGLIVSSCHQFSGVTYPSDFHQYEVLRSFKAPPIEKFEGKSYRLTWHAWHKTPGLILANCDNASCFVELRFTDGYGTYRQGKLKGERKTEITREEFHKLEIAFEEGGFDSLEPHLRIAEEYRGIKQSEDDGVILICMHAPSYYLESFDGSRKHLIFRYCQDNYDDGIRVAMPLIELAEHHFPSEMRTIVAFWIQDEREAEKGSE